MTATAQIPDDFVQRALEQVRPRYVAQGFDFITQPDREQVPPFMGSYRPDAIALKPDARIAIEVQRRPGTISERSLSEIRRLFEGQSDWRFVVVNGAQEPQAAITPASPLAIRGRTGEIRALAAQGQTRAAMVLGWALLEAALHRLDGERGKRPRAPGTVVETLSMLGQLAPETARALRPLIALRNRIVHGDMEAEPTAGDIDTLLTAIDEALA